MAATSKSKKLDKLFDKEKLALDYPTGLRIPTRKKYVSKVKETISYDDYLKEVEAIQTAGRRVEEG